MNRVDVEACKDEYVSWVRERDWWWLPMTRRRPDRWAAAANFALQVSVDITNNSTSNTVSNFHSWRDTSAR